MVRSENAGARSVARWRKPKLHCENFFSAWRDRARGEEATLGGHVAEPEADREPEAVADPIDPEVEEADPEDPWVEY